MKMNGGLVSGDENSGPFLRRLDESKYVEEDKAYFEDCQNEFFTDDIINSGLISLNDFEERSMNLCGKFSTNSTNSTCAMTDTDELQSVFFSGVCVSLPDSDKCLSELKSLKKNSVDLGYIVSPRRMMQAQSQVDNMCVQMHNLIFGREIFFQPGSNSTLPEFNPDLDLPTTILPPSNDSNSNLPGSAASNLPHNAFATLPEAGLSSGGIIGITIAATVCLLL